MAEQLQLADDCKTCGAEAVGSSITGEGHVCRRHNEREWGEALRSYWPEMAARLLTDSKEREDG